MITPFLGQRPEFSSGGCNCGSQAPSEMALNFGLMTMMMQTMASLFAQCFGQGNMAVPGSAAFGGDPNSSGNGLSDFLGGQRKGPRSHHQTGKSTKTATHSKKPKTSDVTSRSTGKLTSKLPGPLKKHAGDFEKYGEKYGVDPKFLAAISMLETGKGTSQAFKSGHNAMGVSNASGPISFKSADASIEQMARVLGKKNGAYAGKHTIGQIASVYCPVGAGNDVNGTNGGWPSSVSKFFKQLGGNPNSRVK